MRTLARSPRRRARRGGALLLSLVAVAVVTVLSVAFLRMTATVARRQALANEVRSAFYLAEAGLNEAYAGMVVGRTGAVGTEALPAAFGEGLFWTEASELGDGLHEINATGMAGGARATLSMVVEEGRESLASLGVFSGASLVVPGGVEIDGYDSSAGTYDEHVAAGTNDQGVLTSNGEIQLQGSLWRPVVVRGDVRSGGGLPVLTFGSVTVTGASASSSIEVELPAPVVPDLPLEPPVVATGGATVVLPTGDGGLERLSLGPGASAVAKGPSRIVVGALELDAAELRFDTADGSVELFVRDRLEVGPGSQLVCEQEDPTALSIVYLGETEALLDADTALHGSVYAPAGGLRLDGGFELFGSVVAAELALASGVRLHVDRALEAMEAEALLPTLRSWRILELGDAAPASPLADPFRLLGLDRSALPSPADAHADTWLSISYVDRLGATRGFDGWESGFDWSEPVRVLAAARGDEGEKASADGGVEKNHTWSWWWGWFGSGDRSWGDDDD